MSRCTRSGSDHVGALGRGSVQRLARTSIPRPRASGRATGAPKVSPLPRGGDGSRWEPHADIAEKDFLRDFMVFVDDRQIEDLDAQSISTLDPVGRSSAVRFDAQDCSWTWTPSRPVVAAVFDDRVWISSAPWARWIEPNTRAVGGKLDA